MAAVSVELALMKCIPSGILRYSMALKASSPLLTICAVISSLLLLPMTYTPVLREKEEL